MQITKIIFLLSILYYPISNIALAGNFTCTVSAINLNFGSINPYDYTSKAGLTTISVTCARHGANISNVAYSLSFSPGNSLNASARALNTGIKAIAYNIYSDSLYNQVLANGTGGTQTISNSYTIAKNTSRTDTYTIYGKIPVQPLASAGSYADLITITLNWVES